VICTYLSARYLLPLPGLRLLEVVEDFFPHETFVFDLAEALGESYLTAPIFTFRVLLLADTAVEGLSFTVHQSSPSEVRGVESCLRLGFE
jgi:hypothetical protein